MEVQLRGFRCALSVSDGGQSVVWDDLLALSQPLVAEITMARDWLRGAPPRQLTKPEQAWHLWSDASDQGLCVAILDPVARTVVARYDVTWQRFPALRPPVPIRRREFYAGLLVWALADGLCPGADHMFRVFNDKTVAAGRLRRGSSSHVDEERALASLWRRVVRPDRVRTTEWVPTWAMVADIGTRAA
eukprot:TRINITY_DN363_c3_g1_i2.p1 TRINITY_DN363_c3_g1~~TRINITY_DN363_c3_g1_i2.p1  ORF type:complete len:189 (+),score=6.83 TRINITY_DN363_c3_g1_i2:2-568(+)